MKRQAGLAKFAGHDPWEREIGWAGKPCSDLVRAMIGSRAALARVRRYKDMAVTAPPTAAIGRFPYPHATVDLAEPRAGRCRARVESRRCRNPASLRDGYCPFHLAGRNA